MIEQVRHWFSTRQGSLLLPDGWYGRPYDNLHSLTSINIRDGNLQLILDDKLTLLFVNPSDIEFNDNELVFTRFDKLAFTVINLSDKTVEKNREYYGGIVKILA